MEQVLYILLAVVILLVMIVIHEFGHYVAGKALKFKINEFSIGFGPKLLSKKKKNGEVFSLRLIPLGGYCAFEGETDEQEPPQKPIVPFEELESAQAAESTDKTLASDANCGTAADKTDNAAEKTDGAVKSFIAEKPYKRIIVLLAGGVFNLLSAVIFSFIFILAVGYATPVVNTVYTDIGTGEPYCELIAGDRIVAVNGKEITVMKSFNELVGDYGLGDNLTLSVVRGGQNIDINATIRTIVTKDGESYSGLGITSDGEYVSGKAGDAFVYCVPFAAKMAWTILGSFGQLITGKIGITSLTGPIGTIGMMATVSAANWRNILLLLPLIAANLGLFNLLPIPALDGSKVVFTVIEWIRGKPINRKVENAIHSVGLFALLGLVVFIDILGMFLR